MKKMLLVDGNSLLFRAYYATAYGRPMKTRNGLHTNAVYGFNMMLNKALEMVRPDAVVVAFDTDQKTFRHDAFPAYKGTRKPTPQELIVQFPIVRELLDAMHVKRFEQEGKEADDIVGSIARNYPDWDINILTSDQDLLQLIDATTRVWLMKKGLTEIQEMTVESLRETMGLSPEQIIDLKGLMGDNGDNIPGIPNVGEKTAMKLLNQYQNLENVLRNVDEIKGKLGENIKNNFDIARLSKKLATIDCKMQIPLDLNELGYETDNIDLYNFYLKYEMHSFLNRLTSIQQEEKEAEEISVTNVKAIPKAYQTSHIALYIDHDFANYFYATIYGFALSDGHACIYLSYEDACTDEAFRNWLTQDNDKIVYDSKAVYHLCANHGFDVSGIGFDVKIGAFLIDNFMTDWDKLCNKYHLSTLDQQTSIYGNEGKLILPDETLQIDHAGKRSRDIAHLYCIIKEDLGKMEMADLFYRVEMPLAKILFEMEKTGITVDLKVLDEISDRTLAKINALTAQIHGLAKREFNINSPKQLAEVLFDDLKLPTNKKRSTAIDVLEKLLDHHEIIACLIEYRKYQKLYSTYAEGLKKYVGDDHKIHTIFNQTITQTGRLSSTEPNLQNIAVRSEEGREIRKAFVAEPGCVLVSADYSQIELRVLAHMANEEKLIKAFNDREDIHTSTAMEVFRVSKGQVTADMRRQAKVVNFGIIYGISDYGLAQQLQVDRKTAQTFIDLYFESYPRIKEFMDEVILCCQTNGYVKTMLNRRRYIPEINDKNYMTREFGKRAAMNAPIQGTAADLIKVAMINIDRMIRHEGYKSKMILQVHDELIFNVVQEEKDAMCNLIEREMEQALHLNVPLEAKCIMGFDWYDAG